MRVVEGTGAIDDVDALIAQLNAIGEEYDCAIAAFDARYLVGPEHIARAVELAERAFRRDENVADARAIEILLYAAGRRQIDRALEMGVSAGEGPVVVVIEAEPGPDDRTASERAKPDGRMERDGEDGTSERETRGGEANAIDPGTDREKRAATAVRRALPAFDPGGVLDDYDEQAVRAFFGVTPPELAATDADLSELVLERVVLLDVEK